ncbi:MAG: tetratricopeptide repeat protein [bacterium]|nr:tetratricopeptide repeat protein [bacterium]
MRHGCLLAVVGWSALAVAGPPSASAPARVRSKNFDVEYRVNPAALPLEAVRLWYTVDRGASWSTYGLDDDRQSPVSFNAPGEGLFGFFIVVENGAGASGAEPQSGTEPHLWAYIDYTPPVVQVHRPQFDPRAADGAAISVRWTALDTNLPPRPIALAFRLPPDGDWRPIARNLANTGRYDWRLPEGLTGRVMIRVRVEDRGGNVVEGAGTIDLQPPPESIATRVRGDDDAVDATLTAAARPVDEAKRRRARKLYKQGRWHADRGERRLAMARLRDALKLDPTLSVALVDLASLLYVEGDYEGSSRAYDLVLRQAPGLRSAREGAARTHIARRQYDLAALQLRKIVDDNPLDVDAWLNLGDTAIYRGNELDARDYYQKAATLDPVATDVIARAQLRLRDITGLRERYSDRDRAP